MSGAKPKGGDLSPSQKIEVAFFHYIRGISQNHLAEIYAVNSGRVSEACKTIGAVVGITEPGYKDRESDK